VEVGGHQPLTETKLRDNFPNPFAGETQIRYDLSTTSDVSIEIFTMQGLMIRSWENSAMQPGSHSQLWDGSDGMGQRVPAGVYTCRMKAGEFSYSLKMVMIR
jgi:flagellar hook assembly protein FlgD